MAGAIQSQQEPRPERGSGFGNGAVEVHMLPGDDWHPAEHVSELPPAGTLARLTYPLLSSRHLVVLTARFVLTKSGRGENKQTCLPITHSKQTYL